MILRVIFQIHGFFNSLLTVIVMKQNLSMKTHLKAIKIVLCALVLGVCVAVQATLPSPNSGMVSVPKGWFLRGDAIDSESDAHTNQVFVDAFQMDTNLITYSNWQLVYQYATNNGYSFVNAGSGFGPNDPVQTVSWYDAVKWCNARSKMEGKTPCYYTDTSLTMVYTSGIVSLTTNNVNWTANGYRLPTEAEWEKAARGGLTTNRFPWGMTISQSIARYQSAMVLPVAYDLGPANSIPLSTRPVGTYYANGFGLYDMAGNVDEWCWDLYSSTYYSSTTTNNPQGPASGSARIARGGDWNSAASVARCAARSSYAPSLARNVLGFRCVQGKQSQTITFNSLPNHFYGDGPITLVATGGGSTSPVIFTNTGPATISGNVLTITGAGLVTVTANQAGDATYSAASPVSQSFTVNQATPLVNATGGTFTYNGTAKASSGTATGGAGETLAVALSYAGTGSTSYGPTASAPSAAGTYTVTASTAGDANNTAGSSSAVALTINKASLSITATNASKVYGQTLSFAGTEFTPTGLVGSDSVSSVTLTSTGTTNTAPVANSPYIITPSSAIGSGLGNYSITYNPGYLTVSNAVLTVTANDASKSYGVTNPVFTASYSGFVNGETNIGPNSVLNGSPSLTTVATTTTIAGSYPITVTNGTLSATNYTFNFVNGILTITNFNGIVDAAALRTFLGNGIVDQAGLNVVLANYWASSPPHISDFDISAKTNFTFIITNFNFTMQFSTNLVNPNWQDLGQAVFQFTDTNAINNQTGFYRLVAPTNQ